MHWSVSSTEYLFDIRFIDAPMYQYRHARAQPVPEPRSRAGEGPHRRRKKKVWVSSLLEISPRVDLPNGSFLMRTKLNSADKNTPRMKKDKRCISGSVPLAEGCNPYISFCGRNKMLLAVLLVLLVTRWGLRCCSKPLQAALTARWWRWHGTTRWPH